MSLHVTVRDPRAYRHWRRHVVAIVQSPDSTLEIRFRPERRCDLIAALDLDHNVESYS